MRTAPRAVTLLTAVLALGLSSCSSGDEATTPTETVTVTSTPESTTSDSPIAGSTPEAGGPTQDDLDAATRIVDRWLSGVEDSSDCATFSSLTYRDPGYSAEENDWQRACEKGPIDSYEIKEARAASLDPGHSDGALRLDPNAVDVFVSVTYESEDGTVTDDTRYAVALVGEKRLVWGY